MESDLTLGAKPRGLAYHWLWRTHHQWWINQQEQQEMKGQQSKNYPIRLKTTKTHKHKD